MGRYVETYIKEQELLSYSRGLGPYKFDRVKKFLSERTSSTEVSVFLSYSHEDKKFVEEAKYLLASQGVKVYVDSEDPELPN